jgi:hypothetical protein
MLRDALTFMNAPEPPKPGEKCGICNLMKVAGEIAVRERDDFDV